MAYELNVNLDAFDVPDELTIDDLSNVKYIWDEDIYHFLSLDAVYVLDCDKTYITMAIIHPTTSEVIHFNVVMNYGFVQTINRNHNMTNIAVNGRLTSYRED